MSIAKIHKEISERFRDEPNGNAILGYTMGVLEKHKKALIKDHTQNLANKLCDCGDTTALSAAIVDTYISALRVYDWEDSDIVTILEDCTKLPIGNVALYRLLYEITLIKSK